MKHIVCFGDSNTHGFCAASGERFDETQRWTKLLQKMLGNDFLIIEEGLSGRTTTFEDPIHEGMSGVDYIYPCLMSHEPVDLLVIMLGTNDTKERFGASAACIALGLKRLVEKAMATTAAWRNGSPKILIIAPKNIDKRYEETEVVNTMGHGCAEKSAQVPEEFKKIAEQMGCAFLDANTVVPEQNQIDFMHLTGEGHRKLALALASLVPGLS